MRLALESHSKICCFDEFSAYKALATGAYTVPAGTAHVGFKIPRWTEQLTEPLLEDAGLDCQATNFYRGEPILFLQRDVRDTVASMLKPRKNYPVWVPDWGIRILEWKIQRYPVFRERYAREIADWHASGDSWAAAGALFWKFKTDSYTDYLQRGFPMLSVGYDEMVLDPRATFARVCDFLGVDWEDGLLNHAAFPHGDIRPDGLTLGDTDPNRPIFTESVGQWKRMLTAQQLEEIRRICPGVAV